MALQTSGAISLDDIQTEFGGTNPIAISEYYAAAAGIPASGAISIGDFYGAASGPSTGLTSALFTDSGNNNAWVSRSVSMSGYGGALVRPVFLHTGLSGFRGDLQLDQIGFDSAVESFETGVADYETTRRSTADYGTATFYGVLTSTTTGYWNRDSGGTPSGSTGRTDAANGSYYLYSEVSSYFTAAHKYYLRGPIIALAPDVANLNFSEARYGVNMGTLTAHLDVIQVPSDNTTGVSASYPSGYTAEGANSVDIRFFNNPYGYGLETPKGALNNNTLPDGSELIAVYFYGNPGGVGVRIYSDASSFPTNWTRVYYAGQGYSGSCLRTNVTTLSKSGNETWGSGIQIQQGQGGSNTFDGDNPFYCGNTTGADWTLSFV